MLFFGGMEWRCCDFFYVPCILLLSIICFWRWVLAFVMLATLQMGVGENVLCFTAVTDSTSLYFCPLQNIEDILEPSRLFSLLLSCLNFTRNRRKHAGVGSAIHAISVYVYSLYSGAMVSRVGLYSQATFQQRNGRERQKLTLCLSLWF